MRFAACILLVALLSGLSVSSDQGAPSGQPRERPQTSLPTVLAADVPTVPDFLRLTPWDFEAVIRVTTDGQRISEAKWVSGSEALAGRAADNVRGWRLAPHTATTFEVTYRVTHVPAACTPRDPQVTARLPGLIEVSIQNGLYCDPPVILDLGPPLVLSRVWGILSSNVTLPVPIADAHLVLEGTSGQFKATQKSDRSGHFEFKGVPKGHYTLQADAAGHESRTWQIDVSDEVPRLKQADFQLRVDRHMLPPRAPVARSAIPTYPVSARQRGLEGTVRLRASPAATAGEPVRVDVIEGSLEMTPSAVENLKTWHIEFQSPSDHLDVTFIYSLLPGDCSGDEGPFVELLYPNKATISMKREVRCGPRQNR